MDFNEYQKASRKTAIYANAGNNLVYPTLGLAGETGEVVEKIKKLIRNDGVESSSEVTDDARNELKKEIGDVLWYIAQLSTELKLELSEVAETNLEKLNSRLERGTLHSTGDNR